VSWNVNMPAAEELLRSRIVIIAMQDVGVPYQWGGNDPEKDGGLDCSGAVLRWWRSAGIAFPDMSAEVLRQRLAVTDTPKPGDLAFYSPDASNASANHVVMVLSPNACIGANGGTSPNPSETTSDYRSRMNAKMASVRLVDHRNGGLRYRGVFLDFRSCPIPAT